MASRPWRAPVVVADVLASAVPGLGEHMQVERIRARWAQIAGPEANRRSRPESLRHGLLTVVAESSPWLHELTLRSAELLGRVQAGSGNTVTALRFVLGRMPAVAPPRAARARMGPTPPLDEEARRDIAQMTAGIGDAALAATLERILTKDRLARERNDGYLGRPRERHDA